MIEEDVSSTSIHKEKYLFNGFESGLINLRILDIKSMEFKEQKTFEFHN